MADRFRTGLIVAVTVPVLILSAAGPVYSQAESRQDVFSVEYVHYRQAAWETERVTEEPYERLNRGGYVFVYFTNRTAESQRVRDWYANGRSGASYRLGDAVAWDRFQATRLEPGALGVLEISGISQDFAAGADFDFGLIGGNWRRSGRVEARLVEDDVQVSFIRVLPGAASVEVHLRNRGDTGYAIRSAEVVGSKAVRQEWVSRELDAGGTTIGRLHLQEALEPGALLAVRINLADGDTERAVYAHRRAHEDFFPIGTWGADREHYAFVRRHHIDTIVQGGRSDDAFYGEAAGQYGFRTMVHTGVYPDVDVLRDLGGHPAPAAWMIQDEPDWSMTPQMILTAVETTHRYDSRKPTFITLCRNGKFFEYAFLPDIAGQDHYSVTAPSSSIWPERYGTRLEETAYYTRDLKRAAEPKPIWIWSQALFDWDERPKRPVPTPEELQAQLFFNLGRGAKGLLWFTFRMSVGDRYPELQQAVQSWGRVMAVTRDGLLGAEPVDGVVQAPEALDVAMLAGWDRLFVIATNTDYEIHDEAYPWRPVSGARLRIRLPDWITPKTVALMDGETIEPLSYRVEGDRLDLDLGEVAVGAFVVIDAERTMENYRAEWAEVIASETAGD